MRSALKSTDAENPAREAQGLGGKPTVYRMVGASSPNKGREHQEDCGECEEGYL